MNLRRPAATSGVAAALLALAPSALAAPTPIAAERVIIDFKGRKGRDPGTLASRLEGNCVPVSALAGWSVDFDGIDGIWAGGPLPTTGSIDAAARRGAVASTAGGLLLRVAVPQARRRPPEEPEADPCRRRARGRAAPT